MKTQYLTLYRITVIGAILNTVLTFLSVWNLYVFLAITIILILIPIIIPLIFKSSFPKGSIHFHHYTKVDLLESLKANDWIVQRDSNANFPEFNLHSNLLYGKILEIRDGGRYFMEHPNPAKYENRITKIKYNFKPGNDWVLYSNLKIIRDNGIQSKLVYINYTEGNKDPLKVSDNEWKIYTRLRYRICGWRQLSVNINDDILKTSGQNGWKYMELIGIRIRGELALRKIDFYI
jgi:hypothetical protein